MISEDDFYKGCLKAHGLVFSDDESDDGKSESDDELRSIKPPPIPYNEFKHKVLKLNVLNNKHALNTLPSINQDPINRLSTITQGNISNRYQNRDQNNQTTMNPPIMPNMNGNVQHLYPIYGNHIPVNWMIRPNMIMPGPNRYPVHQYPFAPNYYQFPVHHQHLGVAQGRSGMIRGVNLSPKSIQVPMNPIMTPAPVIVWIPQFNFAANFNQLAMEVLYRPRFVQQDMFQRDHAPNLIPHHSQTLTKSRSIPNLAVSYQDKLKIEQRLNWENNNNLNRRHSMTLPNEGNYQKIPQSNYAPNYNQFRADGLTGSPFITQDMYQRDRPPNLINPHYNQSLIKSTSIPNLAVSYQHKWEREQNLNLENNNNLNGMNPSVIPKPLTKAVKEDIYQKVPQSNVAYNYNDMLASTGSGLAIPKQEVCQNCGLLISNNNNTLQKSSSTSNIPVSYRDILQTGKTLNLEGSNNLTT